jgi:DNA adenine methylase
LGQTRSGGPATDLERAARFLYLQHLAFGGKVAGRNFGVDTNGPSRFYGTKLGPLLDEIHERLASVVTECLPWADFLDSATTLFYLDPPYWGSETNYGAIVFMRTDFIRMPARLSSIAGRFILTAARKRTVHEVRDVRKTDHSTTNATHVGYTGCFGYPKAAALYL